MLDKLYQRILKPVLFRTDPEKVHDAFVNLGQFMGRHHWSRQLIDRMYGYNGPDIAREVDGITYRTPTLLAAGFDYNGRLIQILPHLGFGGVEIGSVTAEPCEGNPKPRLQRLIKSQSLLVNKGLRNAGAKAILQNLSQTEFPKDFVVGISFARTNSPKTTDLQASIDDYCFSYRAFAEAKIGDYYTFNISCPNVFGGENFADPDRLRMLCKAIQGIPNDRPKYAKMPINLSWEQFHPLLAVLDEYGFQGVIIGNLWKDYGSLDFPDEAPKEYSGGVSGKPCRDASTRLIRLTRQKYGSRFSIMGCGGILSPEDAQEKFAAGADLLQMITGMIFTGPHLMREIAQSIANSPATVLNQANAGSRH